MEVLVVGAGPTGLVLALWLSRKGIPVRIIDRNSGPGLFSRAVAVQARTLEFYRMLGFGDEFVERGIPLDRFHLWEHSREAVTLNLGDIGESLSPYNFSLSLPQDEHEKFLSEKLAQSGVQVEWSTELVVFHRDETGVEFELKKGSSGDNGRVKYLCGCDGAHSFVRQQCGIDFPGGTYTELFYVADVEATGTVANAEGFNGYLSNDGFCLAFPVRTSGMKRLIGIVPTELKDRKDLSFEAIRASVESLIPLKVGKVNWFSTYHVHHRVADHFQAGNAFLLGDAGHIHSPAGGQGMNTGIGDAVNLGWKLAACLRNEMATAVIDTYEPERIHFARSLVESTDRLFGYMTGHGFTSRLIRDELLPHLGPFLLGFAATRRAAFQAISQLRINYEDSDLSEGKAGSLKAGDRLPWVSTLDNFAPLNSLQWQAHVYGKPITDLQGKLGSILLHEFAWTIEAENAGLKEGLTYLIRPDGHIATVGPAEHIVDYIHRWAIKPTS